MPDQENPIPTPEERLRLAQAKYDEANRRVIVEQAAIEQRAIARKQVHARLAELGVDPTRLTEAIEEARREAEAANARFEEGLAKLTALLPETTDA